MTSQASEPLEIASGTSSRSDRVSLLEAIVIFAISAAIIIFIFAMSAAALGDYQFRLPEFLTDSVKTMWSLVAAGGVAVTGSSLDLLLRREPRRTNYVVYILATTSLLFVPIIGLMVYGNSSQDHWSVPAGATRIDILAKVFPKHSFSVSTLVSPAPVTLYLSGDVMMIDGHVKGTASGRITRSGRDSGGPGQLRDIPGRCASLLLPAGSRFAVRDGWGGSSLS